MPCVAPVGQRRRRPIRAPPGLRRCDARAPASQPLRARRSRPPALPERAGVRHTRGTGVQRRRSRRGAAAAASRRQPSSLPLRAPPACAAASRRVAALNERHAFARFAAAAAAVSAERRARSPLLPVARRVCSAAQPPFPRVRMRAPPRPRVRIVSRRPSRRVASAPQRALAACAAAFARLRCSSLVLTATDTSPRLKTHRHACAVTTMVRSSTGYAAPSTTKR